jgi:hypothetical protein
MARADKTVVLNVRVSERQAKWLRNVAEAQHSGNLSEAVRQTLTDSWILRRVRDEYETLERYEGFRFPPDENGLTRPVEFLLRRNIGLTWDDEDVEVL